jgi:hypothetical protein
MLMKKQLAGLRKQFKQPSREKFRKLGAEIRDIERKIKVEELRLNCESGVGDDGQLRFWK